VQRSHPGAAEVLLEEIHPARVEETCGTCIYRDVSHPPSHLEVPDTNGAISSPSCDDALSVVCCESCQVHAASVCMLHAAA